jgi:hypothetical protein
VSNQKQVTAFIADLKHLGYSAVAVGQDWVLVTVEGLEYAVGVSECGLYTVLDTDSAMQTRSAKELLEFLGA